MRAMLLASLLVVLPGCGLLERNDAIDIAASAGFVAVDVFEEKLEEFGLERQALRQEIESLRGRLQTVDANSAPAHEVMRQLRNLEEKLGLVEEQVEGAMTVAERVQRLDEALEAQKENLKSEAASEAVRAVVGRMGEAVTETVERRTRHVSTPPEERDGFNWGGAIGSIVMLGLNLAAAAVSREVR